MSFGEQLQRLKDVAAYPQRGVVAQRWGQMLREGPELAGVLRGLAGAGNLVPLQAVATVKSGVVTRANAYFIVRELPFSEVPKRFGLTRRDYDSSAVVLDGVETPFRIERRFLKPLLKGPEDILAPLRIERTNLRLFNVNVSKEALTQERATGASTYLRRGETFDYRTSSDELKGGIPSERAQVKVRRPFWYSLHVPERAGPAVVVPEHYDRRYVAGFVDATNDVVVNDTLYTVEPIDAAHAQVLHMSLNSLLAWYQFELRGRTQHGQGVLKVKIPDYKGLLVLNPDRMEAGHRRRLTRAFAAIAAEQITDSLESLADPRRVEFDEAILEAAGHDDPSGLRAELETELRAAVAERRERRLSVADAQIERRRVRGTAQVDALATRIAASCEPYPNPRDLIVPGTKLVSVPVLSEVDGALRVGVELFNQNEVFAGDVCIVRAPGALAARFALAVLLHDTSVNEVEIPDQTALAPLMQQWEAQAADWRLRFEAAANLSLRNTPDQRTRDAVKSRALSLLHAK